MADRNIPDLRLYPEDRRCTAPTTTRILELFNHLSRIAVLDQTGRALRTFHPELDPIHEQILDLLDLPATAYAP